MMISRLPIYFSLLLIRLTVDINLLIYQNEKMLTNLTQQIARIIIIP